MTFGHRHENKSCSAGPSDQHKHLTYDSMIETGDDIQEMFGNFFFDPDYLWKNGSKIFFPSDILFDIPPKISF